MLARIGEIASHCSHDLPQSVDSFVVCVLIIRLIDLFKKGVREKLKERKNMAKEECGERQILD